MDDTLDSWMFNEEEKERLRFYKDFVSVEDAKAFTELLNSHDIPFAAEVPQALIDPSIVGTGMLPKAIVKLLPEDFKRVNELLADQIKGASFADVQGHYLNQFETDELQDIFTQPDKWTVEDVQVAKIILKERGVPISEEQVQQLRESRLQEIRDGKPGSKLWMAIYFLSILLIFLHPIFFVAGVGMGYYYAFGKSVDPDGHRHFVFDPQTRFYGKMMLFGGLAALAVALLFLFGVL